jgi:hypothetical protein
MTWNFRIFTIPKLGEKLKQDLMPLTYTPRKFISHPYNTIFYVIESDHRTYGPKAVSRILADKVSQWDQVLEWILKSISGVKWKPDRSSNAGTPSNRVWAASSTCRTLGFAC